MDTNIYIDDDLIKRAIAYTVKEKRTNFPGYMSQGELAEKAQVNINTIVEIEKARMCPTLIMIIRLSKALDYENEFEIFKYIEEKYNNLKIVSSMEQYKEIHGNDFKKIKINSKSKNTIQY